MSKSLIKLVDEAILPAFLIVGIKVIGIAITNNLLSLTYYYHNFGKISYPYHIDAITVNTYSDSIVFAVFLIIIIGLLVKLLHFSDNKANPEMILRLAKANKLGFIQTSIEIYHILFVWMVFFTGIVIYIILRCLSFTVNAGLALPVIITYLAIIWVIIKEVEKDIIKRLDFGKNNLV